MTSGFIIGLSIAICIFITTSAIVLIRRRRQNIHHTGQVIHYGGPPLNVPPNGQQNAPPPPQDNSSLPSNFLTISPQAGEPHNYQTSGLPSYQNAVYCPPGPIYPGSPTPATNIIIRPANAAQYYPDSYQTGAVVVTTTNNVPRY